MAGKSNYLEAALLNHRYRSATLAKPTTVYVSLHTGDPGDTGANEVSGGGYARVAVPVGDASWFAPVAVGNEVQRITNVNAITFPVPTGANWGTVAFFGIWDAAVGGNYWEGGPVGAYTLLVGAITAVATTITVASASGFPTSGSYTITIDDEQLTVTAGQGTTVWTVTRGAGATGHTDSAGVLLGLPRTINAGDSAPSIAPGALALYEG